MSSIGSRTTKLEKSRRKDSLLIMCPCQELPQLMLLLLGDLIKILFIPSILNISSIGKPTLYTSNLSLLICNPVCCLNEFMNPAEFKASKVKD